MKDAVTTFSDNVADKAKGEDGQLGTEDDVNHRIAVVGFSTRAEYKTGTVPDNALQNMWEASGVASVDSAIDDLYANGSTYIDKGIAYANNIFDANPVDLTNRNRVIIVFTDGVPGYSTTWYDDSESTGNLAISNAYTTKNSHHATSYTVGIFSGANAENPGSLPSYANNGSNETNNANRMMHLISSNYLSAKSFTDTGSGVNPDLNGNSYYLSAADSDTLNNIFQQISDNIESGGSTTTLDSSAVIKDIVAPSFMLPEGTAAADISIKSYPCIDVEKSNDGTYTYTFGTEEDDAADGASATVDGDKVNVTGFDFAKHYCGTNVATDHSEEIVGSKLVISFTVVPKDGFLGGNNVPTNTSAGVYENAEADTPVMTFPVPTVNVPIVVPTVEVTDYNVYLMGGVDDATILSGTTVKVPGADGNPKALDLEADNYGLEPWQNAYVNISVPSAGTTVYNNMTQDDVYTVSVTIEPNEINSENGYDAVTAKNASDTGNIYVYKPTITYKDSVIDPGETPNYEEDNFVSPEWFHGETNADSVTMTGTAPTLTYTYDPAEQALSEETYVNVTVEIGEVSVDEYVTFAHEECELDLPEACTFDPTQGEFLIHMNSFDLVIKKIVNVDELKKDPGQTFIFNITGPNEYKQQVVLRGNEQITLTKLPVGEYIVTEDTSWSWRYDVDGEATVTITSASINNGKAVASFTNIRKNEQWLDGNTSIKNTFGQKSTDNG